MIRFTASVHRVTFDNTGACKITFDIPMSCRDEMNELSKLTEIALDVAVQELDSSEINASPIIEDGDHHE